MCIGFALLLRHNGQAPLQLSFTQAHQIEYWFFFLLVRGVTQNTISKTNNTSHASHCSGVRCFDLRRSVSQLDFLVSISQQVELIVQAIVNLDVGCTFACQ